MSFTIPTYGTGWTAPYKPDWKLVPKNGGGRWPWEDEPNAATETNFWRKGPCRVTVVNENNTPVSGVQIRVRQTDLAFEVGNIFRAPLICDDPLYPAPQFAAEAETSWLGHGPITALDRATYRARLLDAGFNSWKPEAGFFESEWEGTGYFFDDDNPGERKEMLVPALEWLKNRVGKKWRRIIGDFGTYSSGNVYKDVQACQPPNNTEAQRSDWWRNVHFPDKIAATAPYVQHWQMTNELSFSGSCIYAGGQNSARLQDNLRYARTVWGGPSGHTDFIYADGVSQQAVTLTDNGARIDRVTLQGHVSGGGYGSFSSELARMSQLNDLSPAPWGCGYTEFDVSGNSATQASTVEAVLRACMANPNAECVYFYNFWKALSWLPLVNPTYNKFGFFDLDWSPLPAKTALDTVLAEWRTDITGNTNGSGYTEPSCFFGTYEITATINGVPHVQTVEVKPSMKEVVFFVLPDPT